MCETRSRVPVSAVVAAVGAVGAVSLVVAWLAGVWPLLLAGAGVAGAVCAALAWLSRRLARLAVVNWPSRGWAESPAVLRARLALPAKSAKVYWEGSVLPWRHAALPAPIEAPRPVVHAVITGARKRAVR